MKLYEVARNLNKKVKAVKKQRAGRYLSPVRRLERFAVDQQEKLVAMTFDDGPMNLPPKPLRASLEGATSLTQVLIELLGEVNAKGTFNIIGSTEENYPDQMGDLHKPSWSGVKHDHYPEFGKDAFAGAKTNDAIIENLLRNGHELSNHGYQHVLFGKNSLIYGQRECFKSVDEVVMDLSRLHKLIKEKHSYEMVMSRPPHYIDKIPDKMTSYEAYALMGYDYLAASFDGGGWLPTIGDLDGDIRKMVAPMENALKQNPDALNGQIIFQKDGYNMSLMTPVAYALKEHLKLLNDHEYRVITVSELKKQYPFADFCDRGKDFEIARNLDQKGYIIGYKTNDFKPDELLTYGEMITMTLRKEDYKNDLGSLIHDKKEVANLRKHPYYLGFKHYKKTSELGLSNMHVTPNQVEKFFYDSLGLEVKVGEKELKRHAYLNYLNHLLK